MIRLQNSSNEIQQGMEPGMKGILFKMLLVAILLSPLLLLARAPGDPKAGETVFMTRCKICHGADGKGNPAMAKILDAEFPPMDSEYVQSKSPEEMKEVITKGKGKMMPVRGMTEKELENVIAYVHSLSKKEKKEKQD